MVAGIHRLLNEGRVYTYRELVSLIGLEEKAFPRVFDVLVSEGRLRAVLASESGGALRPALATSEHDMLWRATRVA